jgi:hypothetical protein
MKFAVKGLAVLLGGALLMGTVATTAASAGDLRKCTLVRDIDSFGKRLDNALFGWIHHRRHKH